MADTQLASAPPQATITIPAPTVTAGWAVPPSRPEAAAAEPRERRPKSRGIPAAPVLAGAGNATALTLSAAYEAGGVAAVGATGGAVLLGALGATVRRRRTVARRMAARNSRQGGGPGLGSRGGSWQVPRSGSAGGSSAGSRGSGSGARTSGTSSPRTGSTGSAGAGPVRGSTAGLGGTGTPDRVKKTRDKKQRSAAARAAKTAARAGRKAAAAAVKRSRPHRARLWAATKAGVRRSRGASADALRAVRSGVWGALRHWSLRKGAAKAWAAWKQHRANRKTTPPTTPTDRTVASVARKPAHPTTPASSTGGSLVPGHHFTGPATEMARAAAAYQPQGMLQVGQDFIGLKDALELVAEAMKITVENANDKQPLDPRIVELMRNIHGLQLKAAELAGELAPAFRSCHQVDIARLENPRNGVHGEAMWDVRSNLL